VVADTAARTSLAALVKAGLGRLSWLVNSLHRLANLLQVDLRSIQQGRHTLNRLPVIFRFRRLRRRSR
jgi:hypothetical protein